MRTVATKAVLVTGCSGRIGAAACEELLRCEDVAFVRGVDASDCPRQLAHESAFEFVRGELHGPKVGLGCDDPKVGLGCALEGVDTVVHLAACPDDAHWDSVLLPNNVQGTVALLRAIEHRQQCNAQSRIRRLIVASSGKLFAGYHHRGCAPAGGFPIGAHHTPRPVCAYGATKAFAEAAAMAFSSDRRTGCETVALRFAWCPRTADDVAAMRQALDDFAPDEFLAPSDAAQSIAAAVTCPWPLEDLWYVSAFVQSLPMLGRQPRFDVSAAQEMFNWNGPRKRFPDDIDAVVADRSHASDALLRPRDDPHPGVWR